MQSAYRIGSRKKSNIYTLNMAKRQNHIQANNSHKKVCINSLISVPSYFSYLYLVRIIRISVYRIKALYTNQLITKTYHYLQMTFLYQKKKIFLKCTFPLASRFVVQMEWGCDILLQWDIPLGLMYC